MNRPVGPQLTCAASLLVLCACTLDLVPPRESIIECDRSEDCPASYTCQTLAHRCVRATGESTPPGVTDVVWERPAVRASVAASVSFASTEPLLTLPTVELVGPGDATVAMSVVASGPQSFRASRVAQGNEPEGTWRARVMMIDEAGNEALVLDLGAVVFDFTPPDVLSLAIGPTAVSGGGTVRLEATLREPIAQAFATLGESLAFERVADADLAHVLLTVVMPSVPPPTLDVDYGFADVAGNLTQGKRLSAVRFDAAAPNLLDSEVLTPVVGPGRVVAVRLDFDEGLDPVAPATVVLRRNPGGEELPLSVDLVTGTSYLFARNVVLGDPDGDWDVELVAFADESGNPGAPAVLGSVRLDATAPTIGNIVVQGGRVDARTQVQTFAPGGPYQHMTLWLDVSEQLTGHVDPTRDGVLAVDWGGSPLPCSAYSPSSPNYVCSAVVTTQPTGLRTLSIVARDALDSMATASRQLGVDGEAPTLLAASPGRVSYKAEHLVTYTFELSEPVDLASVVPAVRRDAVAQPAFFDGGCSLSSSGATLACARLTPLVAGDAGAYDVSLAIADVFGNAAAALTDPLAIFVVDASPPVVAGLSLVSSNADSTVARAGDVITASFSVDEALGAQPEVVLGDQPMALVSAIGSGPITYTYSRTVNGSDGTGSRVVMVSTADLAGNVASAGVGAIDVDQTAPSISPGTTWWSLAPPVGSLVSSVTRVGVGGRARLSFVVDEELSATPALTITPAGATFSVVLANHSGTFWAFDLTLTGGVPTQGTHQVTVTFTDVAGNTASPTLTLPAPGFVLDTVAPPALSAAQNDSILFTRIPWGSSTSGPSMTAATLGGQTASVEAGATVILWDDAVVSGARELGRAVADSQGVFSTPIVGGDRSEVYLSQVDAAGNLDNNTATLLRNVEWVATMRDKVAGRTLDNPHLYYATPYFDSTLHQASDAGVVEYGGASGVVEAGTVLVTSGTGRWVNRGLHDRPSAREQHASAYDNARGRLVLFGGEYSNFPLADTWEWDGATWEPMAASGPAPRSEHAMAYDASRGEVILFGGSNGSDCLEGAGARCAWTWAWDGAAWRVVATSGPTARSQHSMAYDSFRHRVVLFGGDDGSGSCDLSGASRCRGTWEWDGASWTRVATTGPAARVQSAMAFDPTRPAVVLFGGSSGFGVNCDGGVTPDCDRTWTWNGTSWTLLTTTGAISGRKGLAMAFDPMRGRVVATQGAATTDCGEGDTKNCPYLWELAGTLWQTVTTSGPAGRSRASLDFDARLGRLVLFGGYDVNGSPDCGEGDPSPGNCGSAWFLEGTAWSRQSSVPSGRAEGALAYDLYNRNAVLFGGNASTDCGEGAGTYCPYTWTWDGSAWRQAAVTGPNARINPGMAYFDAGSRPRILLFGGVHSSNCNEGSGIYCGATWLWCANCAPAYWYQPTVSGTPPGARTEPMAAGFGSGLTPTSAVLFGGYRDMPDCGEVLVGPGVYDYRCGHTFNITWGGSSYVWTRPATTGAPQRQASAMAYRSDAVIRTVLFGGGGAGTELADLLEWNGSAWSARAGGPPARQYHSMFYDTARRRTFVLGGEVGSGSCHASAGSVCRDLWEWDGSTWTQHTWPGPVPRSHAMSAFDSTRGKALLFGGSSDGDCGEGAGYACRDMWELDAGARSRPAQVMSATFAASGEDLATITLQEVTARFVAGAIGRSAAACSTNASGARLWVWDRGQWRSTGLQNSSSPATPSALSWTASSDAEFVALPLATRAERMRRLFYGRDGLQLDFAVTPRDANGNGCVNPYASVGVDEVEVRVRYRK